MVDKNNIALHENDWVLYSISYEFQTNVWETIEYVGRITEVHDDAIFMSVHGGCFYCDCPDNLVLLGQQEAMLKLLER